MNPSNKDKIKLAEAMGYKAVPKEDKMWRNWFIIDDRNTWRKFDPFTDANDDYTVLQWAKNQSWWNEFVKQLPNPNLWHFVQDHKIGDFARAALKMLECISKSQS